MSDLKIGRFKPKDFKPWSNIVIIGKRETGKSSVIKWICYYKQKRIRFPLVISDTALLQGMFAGTIPNNLIHRKFNIEALENLKKMQGEIRKLYDKGDPKWTKTKKDAVIILDDISNLDKNWQKEDSIKTFFTAGRHYFTDMIISIHDVMLLNPGFRGNTDYIVITKVTDQPSYEKIYKNYWNPAFGDRKTFNQILHKCTEGFKCLVIDNKSLNRSNNMTDCIFYMENPHPKKIPKHRLCSKIIWEMAKKYEDTNGDAI